MEKVKAALAAILARLVAFYRANPARSISYIVSAIVAVAAFVGLSVDADRLGDVLTLVLPILIGGEAIHRRVSPVEQPTPAKEVQVQVDGREIARAVASAAPTEAQPVCRYGHPIDGTNGDRCPHGHAA